MPSDPATSSAQRWAWVLWLLSGLFLARVVGQIVVILFEPAWLPPMSEWYSGLLAYPLLLPVQIVILAVMVRINLGVTRGAGWFTRPHPRFGLSLLWFAIVYAAGMVARYFLSGQLYPERRFWPPGSLPIFFHFVLAGYLYVLSRLVRLRPDPAAHGSG